MFYVREKPWHGLGTMVMEAPDSVAALRLAELEWNVIQKDIMTADGNGVIPGFKANVRDRDGSVLGIVTDRYRVVQNAEAFSFTDELLGEGVRYETARSLQGGRRTWVPGSPISTSSMERRLRRIFWKKRSIRSSLD